ncbi:hypothetical protein CEXT_788981 [Caerostris extrusa]|uniref:Secreted protein n=1 Tax=Caerostris extrusa TaxID=172846 RepID=A0AAV4MRJ6_CAEEX|nr:hypothetical protein CEXT_788981 [Caerostris extrusa]
MRFLLFFSILAVLFDVLPVQARCTPRIAAKPRKACHLRDPLIDISHQQADRHEKKHRRSSHFIWQQLFSSSLPFIYERLADALYVDLTDILSSNTSVTFIESTVMIAQSFCLLVKMNRGSFNMPSSSPYSAFPRLISVLNKIVTHCQFKLLFSDVIFW